MTRKGSLSLGCSWLWLSACASAPPPPAQAPAASTPAPVAAAPAETEPEPEPTAGPASITVATTLKGQPIDTAVRILDAAGEVVVSGRSGEPLSTRSGEYTLEVAVEDPAMLADKPVQRSALTLEPGASLQHAVPFAWAAIQLRVRVNGSIDRAAEVDIMRGGKVVATIGSEREHVMVSPGRYAARVRTRGAEIEVPQLMFPDGATRTLPVDVQL